MIVDYKGRLVLTGQTLIKENTMAIKKVALDSIADLNNLLEEALGLQHQKKVAEAKYDALKASVKTTLQTKGWKEYLHTHPELEEKVIKAYLYDQERTVVDYDKAKELLGKNYGKVFTKTMSTDCFNITVADKTTDD